MHQPTPSSFAGYLARPGRAPRASDIPVLVMSPSCEQLLLETAAGKVIAHRRARIGVRGGCHPLMVGDASTRHRHTCRRMRARHANSMAARKR